MSDELVAAEERWAEIVRTQDAAAAETFLADDFVLESVGGVSPSMPKREWIDALPQVETRALEPKDVAARVYGDVAVVRLRLVWDAEVGGRDLTGEYAVTDVFTRGAEGWHPSWRISIRMPIG